MEIKQSTCGTHLPFFSHSANLVCSLFFLQVKELIENGHNAPELVIQADNCAKETKNQLFFGLLGLLVEKNIFRLITLSMLHPGHTHEDIDSMFATLKKKLWTFNIDTFEDYVKVFIPKAIRRQQPTPTVKILHHIYDWENFLKPHLRFLSGHMDTRQFKWCKNLGTHM